MKKTISSFLTVIFKKCVQGFSPRVLDLARFNINLDATTKIVELQEVGAGWLEKNCIIVQLSMLELDRNPLAI